MQRHSIAQKKNKKKKKKKTTWLQIPSWKKKCGLVVYCLGWTPLFGGVTWIFMSPRSIKPHSDPCGV
jgi:hypothetical protein